MSDERVPTGDSIRKAERHGPRALRPVRHREYRLLIASGSASLLADGLWLVALVWQVIELGGARRTCRWWRRRPVSGWSSPC